LLRFREGGVANNRAHLVLAEQELDALHHLVDDLAAAVDRLRHVELQIVEGDPVGLGVADEVDDLGVPEQRLARDAAPIEAETANALLLDQDVALAGLRGADGGDVTTGTAADDRDVVLSHVTPASAE